MNKIKRFIKDIISPIFAIYHGIPIKGKHIYIGTPIKVVGGKRIILHDYAEINPYSMALNVGDVSKIEIGNHSRISMFSWVSSSGYVKIEDNVAMGPGVFISDHNHQYEDISKATKYQGITFRPESDLSEPSLIIGEGSWLGAHVAVIGELKIGKHCVIGANSVVTKDIPDYSVAVGAPARVIKRYDFEKKEWMRI